MSNFDSSTKNKTQTTSNLKNLKWKSIQTDLKSALDEWSTLEQKETVLSPEEVQLQKVKNMIENIKDKLNQF